jgi:hypothetical protein
VCKAISHVGDDASELLNLYMEIGNGMNRRLMTVH